jgi:hypothetical protein
LDEIQDGNEYHIDEANGVAPAMDLKIDFVSVTKFNFVHVMGYYNGGSTHSVNIQLYAWSTSTWHTWESHDGAEESVQVGTMAKFVSASCTHKWETMHMTFI